MKRRRLRKRTRKGCVSETQLGRDGWMIAGTRSMISRVERRPLSGREDLVQVAIAAEGARPDVDEGDAAAREVRLEGALGRTARGERVAVPDDDGRRSARAELVALVDLGAARKTAGRQGGCTATGKFFSLSEYGDFRPLALRFPGPRTVSSAGS